jgi:hypothetical protein
MSRHRDWDSEGFRRLFVNGAYWCVGLEAEISPTSSVEPAGSTAAFKRGANPAAALRESISK